MKKIIPIMFMIFSLVIFSGCQNTNQEASNDTNITVENDETIDSTTTNEEEAKTVNTTTDKDVEKLTIDSWDDEDKANKDYQTDINKNESYDNMLKNSTINEKPITIQDLYEMEKGYLEGGYSFDLKHPYNLAMAIEIATKYNDKVLNDYLFKSNDEIEDLSIHIKRDDSNNAFYMIELKNDSIVYSDESGTFLTVNYEVISNTYKIKNIE